MDVVGSVKVVRVLFIEQSNCSSAEHPDRSNEEREQLLHFRVVNAGKYSIPVRSVIEVLYDTSISVAASPAAVMVTSSLSADSI